MVIGYIEVLYKKQIIWKKFNHYKILIFINNEWIDNYFIYIRKWNINFFYVSHIKLYHKYI